MSDARWTPDGRQLVYRGRPLGGQGLLYAASDPDRTPIVSLDAPFRSTEIFSRNHSVRPEIDRVVVELGPHDLLHSRFVHEHRL